MRQFIGNNQLFYRLLISCLAIGWTGHKSLFVTDYFVRFGMKMRSHFHYATALASIFSKIIQKVSWLAVAKMPEFLAFLPPLVTMEIHRSKMQVSVTVWLAGVLIEVPKQVAMAQLA
jgi:hypothetical protein